MAKQFFLHCRTIDEKRAFKRVEGYENAVEAAKVHIEKTGSRGVVIFNKQQELISEVHNKRLEHERRSNRNSI